MKKNAFYFVMVGWLLTSLSFRELPKEEVEIIKIEEALKVPNFNVEEEFIIKRNKIITFYMVKNKTHDLSKISSEDLLKMSELMSTIFINNVLLKNSKHNHVVDYFTDTTDLHKIKTSIVEQVRYGIPASIKLAQSAVETGYGKSIKDNNYFGIKPQEEKDGGEPVLTREYYTKKQFKKNKRKIISHKKINEDLYHCVIKDKFVKFNTPWESFRSHSEFLKNKSRYLKLFTSKDYSFWAEELLRCTYATDINYSKTLIKVIESNNLQLLDF